MAGLNSWKRESYSESPSHCPCCLLTAFTLRILVHLDVTLHRVTHRGLVYSASHGFISLAPLVKAAAFSPVYFFFFFCLSVQCQVAVGTSAHVWLSILSHWSTCLFLCHIFITIVLYYILKSSMAIPPIIYLFSSGLHKL